jgi:hypothetical protein
LNPALSWIIGIASAVLTAVLVQYFYVPFRISQALARYEERVKHIRQDVQDISKAISVNRDAHYRELQELRERFDEFRVKVAAKTGINGR